MPQYTTVIDRGYTPVNDRIIDFLKPRIRAPYLDIGCNVGWLLSEVPGGVGIDASEPLVRMARERGCNVVLGNANALPFRADSFDTAVLSCILEQCDDWAWVLGNARVAARRVIGINPIPGASPWGSVQGWVKSVIPEKAMHELGYRTERVDEQRYYFESSKPTGVMDESPYSI